MKKKIRGSQATYSNGKDKSPTCDLVELATAYQSVGNIPEKMGWTRACEIALLSEAFLILYKKRQAARASETGRDDG